MKFIPKRLVTAALQAAVATGGLVSHQTLFAQQQSDEGVARVSRSGVVPANGQCQGDSYSVNGGYGTGAASYGSDSTGYPGNCGQGYGSGQGCGNGCRSGCGGCGCRHTGHIAHTLNLLNPWSGE